MIDKIKQIFDRLNYGHWGNKILFDKKIQVLSDNFKVINERTYNTSIAFRNTYGTIIGGTIAFLGLFSKDQLTDSIKFWLVLFIISGIIWLIFSYLLDFFVLLATQKYINIKQKEFITYRDKIKKFIFGKDEFYEAKNSTVFQLPGSKPIVIFIYGVSYLLLFFSLFTLIFALIKILGSYNVLI